MQSSAEPSNRQATHGERIEMGQLVREHYDSVYRFCARRVGPDWAADLAQETFLTAQKSIKRFRFESSIKTWLFGIALNECRNLSRKLKLAPAHLEFETTDTGAQSREDAWIDRSVLNQALQKLSDEHREVVILHEIEELTYDEIAVITQVPAGTVKSRLHHAFIKLREILRKGESL